MNQNQQYRQHQQQQQNQHHQPNPNRNIGSAFNHGLGFVDTRCPDAVGSSTNPYGIAANSSPACSVASSNNLVLSTLLSSSSSSVTENSHLARGTSSSGRSNVLSTLLSSSSSSSTSTTSSLSNRSAANESSNCLNGILSSLNVRIKSEEIGRNRIEDRTTTGSLSTSSSPSFNTSLLSSLLSTSRISTNRNNEDEENVLSNKNIKLEYASTDEGDPLEQEVHGIKVEYSSSPGNALEASEEDLSATSPYDIISNNNRSLHKQVVNCRVPGALGKGPSSCNIVSPTSDIVIEMKYETQTGPPTAPPHLTSSGVEPPHSSQGSGIAVGGSPAEIVGVDSLLLSPWGATGPDFIETSDVKQTAAGLQDAWDTILLGSSVGVASAQSLAELKPLPPFTGYTGHLSINGIPGHHYHAIASSAQRPSLQSSSPTPSSNQEYYEAPVVSSSTPCPQSNQKQQHQHQQQHQQAQQQQLPQSTQQVDYDIEDIAEIIGSAIADTTVPGGGNGPGSEHDPDASRDWIDIAEWIDTACSPKAQEQNSPSPYSQIYATTTPSNQAQQHGSTLQSLLTHGYAPLLQARLQAGNAGLQNTSCGETPSSTSPYPPVSPPGRVSTSCSPDHLLHSSFAAPSHPRKRSRPNPGSQNPSKKSPGTTALSYGTESGHMGGKEKPVHRCTICNRGFLNKSNIKVHLRTHTGEKPFRCEVCGKAFRQKAHLIKHQQIHKRIGRD